MTMEERVYNLFCRIWNEEEELDEQLYVDMPEERWKANWARFGELVNREIKVTAYCRAKNIYLQQ